MKHGQSTGRAQSGKNRPINLTARYIVKRRPHQTALKTSQETQQVFQEIGIVLGQSGLGKQQRLLTALAMEDSLALSKLRNQHRILHVTAKTELRPSSQPPLTAGINEKMREYQQLITKLKHNRRNTIMRERPSTPPPESLGVGSYYLDWIQGSNLPNSKIRSISIRK